MSAPADQKKCYNKHKEGSFPKSWKIPSISMVDNSKAETVVIAEVYRSGNFTIAEASISFQTGKNGDQIVYRALGSSVRNPEDKENKSIGSRLAVARALRKLSSIITSETMDEVHKHSVNKKAPLERLREDELEKLVKDAKTEISKRAIMQKQKAKEKAKYLNGESK